MTTDEDHQIRLVDQPVARRRRIGADRADMLRMRGWNDPPPAERGCNGNVQVLGEGQHFRVGFGLDGARALRDRGAFEGRQEPDLRAWLDLTAIGTVADMVPLRGLNRVIVTQGLQQITQTQRVGVRALVEVSGLEPDKITAGRIGFHLGPRINAAGRVAHAAVLLAHAPDLTRVAARSTAAVWGASSPQYGSLATKACNDGMARDV